MMNRFPLRLGAAALGLAGILAVAVWTPIPHLGDPGMEQVVATVHERLPGWEVVHAADTWEGGYAVVASCGPSEIGFQVIPGHGLPIHDAWLQPNDAYSQQRLEEVSDYPIYLVWRATPIVERTLSCHEELARLAAGGSGREASVTSSRSRSTDPTSDSGRRPVD